MARQPLYYTFGNHMHWVNMEWLWGYHVLPGSVRDMIHLCREAGVKGCVNFDGIGYEKLAAEDPEALFELRAAVAEGIIEPVGCTYGQPYGLFHGGESNVRQLIYGARAVRRLLGVWPKTFWEEEFYFFPQLPQMLVSTGFTGASLFFQWTWHTPEIPHEDVPVIWWEGLDGTRILTATRNKLNMHQWPEDMDAVLGGIGISPMVASGVPPELIQQWLELMPSPDWMCRSELILPKLKELLADERFNVIPVTLGEYLTICGKGVPPMRPTPVSGVAPEAQDRDDPVTHGRDGHATIPARYYTMDQVWHGMTLGKNGDRVRARSRDLEKRIQAMESLQAALSIFGRPYANWDVYPVWELEEIWRDLLWTQHHDIDECEGLCGHVADAHLEGTGQKLEQLHSRAAASLGGNDWVRFNPHGWEVDGVPSFGFGPSTESSYGKWEVDEAFTKATYSCAAYSAIADLNEGCIIELCLRNKANLLASPFSLIPLRPEGSIVEDVEVSVQGYALTVTALLDGESCYASCSPDPNRGLMIVMSRSRSRGARTKGGYGESHRFVLEPNHAVSQIWTDTPYGVVQVEGSSNGVRKYPEGDWMTSPQWFEEVESGFVGGSFVTFRDETGLGLLVTQEASTQWFRTVRSYEMVVAAYDPWDEANFHDEDNRQFALLPIASESNAELWQFANTSRSMLHGPWPASSGSMLSCSNRNVVITAFYREAEDFAGKHVENYAGQGMGYPFIIRLVEFDGLESEVEIKVVGPVAKAFKTNFLGQIELELTPDNDSNFKNSKSKIKLHMRPHEIATLYLDIVPGRKQTRDLDAKREVWATVHRVDD